MGLGPMELVGWAGPVPDAYLLGYETALSAFLRHLDWFVFCANPAGTRAGVG